jgi:hypothetical protein
MEKPKPKNLGSAPLLFLFLILTIVGVILSFRNQQGSATVTYGAAFLCLIFSSLEKFEWFEVLGIKAKLVKKIQEANDAINKLKEIAVPFAELLLTQTARSGRIGTIIKRRERYRLLRDIEKPLVELGVTKEELEKIKKDWYSFDLFDLCVPIWKNLDLSLDGKLKEKRVSIPTINIDLANKLHEEIKQLEVYKKNLERIAYQNNLHVAYQDYINFINTCSVFSDREKEKLLIENDALIKDLKYYCDNHDFRRLEYWFKEDDD